MSPAPSWWPRSIGLAWRSATTVKSVVSEPMSTTRTVFSTSTRRLGLERGVDVDGVVADQRRFAEQHLPASRPADGRDDALPVVDLQAGDVRPDQQVFQAHAGRRRLAVTDVNAHAPLDHRGDSV